MKDLTKEQFLKLHAVKHGGVSFPPLHELVPATKKFNHFYQGDDVVVAVIDHPKPVQPFYRIAAAVNYGLKNPEVKISRMYVSNETGITTGEDVETFVIGLDDDHAQATAAKFMMQIEYDTKRKVEWLTYASKARLTTRQVQLLCGFILYESTRYEKLCGTRCVTNYLHQATKRKSPFFVNHMSSTTVLKIYQGLTAQFSESYIAPNQRGEIFQLITEFIKFSGTYATPELFPAQNTAAQTATKIESIIAEKKQPKKIIASKKPPRSRKPVKVAAKHVKRVKVRKTKKVS